MTQLANNYLISDANLKAYYKMELSGLTTDSGPNGYTLTNNNTVGEGSGKYGVCADLGTANTNKSLSIVNDLGITNGACTFSIWVKMRTEISTGQQSLIQHEDSGTSVNYEIRYDYNSGTRRLIFQRYRQSVSADEIYYTVTLGTSNWNHIVLTYDATNLKGYLNGLLVSGPTPFTGNGSGVVSDKFAMGAFRGTTDSFASAYLDDASVFNRALTATEILNLYSDSNFISIL